MLTNCKNGISSYEIARVLKSQKTAWFMLHRIREAMKDKAMFKMGSPGGEVEVDETFVGGKAVNMHKTARRKSIGCAASRTQGDATSARLPCTESSTGTPQGSCKVVPK